MLKCLIENIDFLIIIEISSPRSNPRAQIDKPHERKPSTNPQINTNPFCTAPQNRRQPICLLFLAFALEQNNSQPVAQSTLKTSSIKRIYPTNTHPKNIFIHKTNFSHMFRTRVVLWLYAILAILVASLRSWTKRYGDSLNLWIVQCVWFSAGVLWMGCCRRSNNPNRQTDNIGRADIGGCLRPE